MGSMSKTRKEYREALKIEKRIQDIRENDNESSDEVIWSEILKVQQMCLNLERKIDSLHNLLVQALNVPTEAKSEEEKKE